MSKASCFIDAYAWLLCRNRPFHEEEIRLGLREAVYDLAPCFDHDTLGFHPHLVNAALLALRFPPLAPVDVLPADGTGRPICDVGLIDASAIITGLNDSGNEHAVARDWDLARLGAKGYFDPANRGRSIECPLMGMRTQWVVAW